MENRAYQRKRLRMLAKLVIGPDVLDIGYAGHPLPGLGAMRVVGVDIIHPLYPCDYAEKILGDAHDLRSLLGPRRFNTIVLGDLIEHIEAPYAFLRSLHAFMAPPGRLLLSTPNPLGFPNVFCEILGTERYFYEPAHRFELPERWVRRMLTLSGYEVLAAKSVGLNLLYFAPPSPRFKSYQLN